MSPCPRDSIFSKTLFVLLIAAPLYVFANTGSTLRINHLTLPIPESLYNSDYRENPIGQERHQINVHGRTRSYQAYAPQKNTGQPRSVLILFHGAQRSGVSLVEKWKPIADRFNIILVGPDGLNNGWNLETDGSDFINAVLADAGSRYKMDPQRIYLFGHSLGGNFALYISIIYSRVIAASAIHAGMFTSPDHYGLPTQAKRKIPVAFFIGTDDQLYPLDQVRKSAEAFAVQGHETELNILGDHNHWYYDAAPFINENAWFFLSRHKLN